MRELKYATDWGKPILRRDEFPAAAPRADLEDWIEETWRQHGGGVIVEVVDGRMIACRSRPRPFAAQAEVAAELAADAPTARPPL